MIQYTETATRTAIIEQDDPVSLLKMAQIATTMATTQMAMVMYCWMLKGASVSGVD